MSQSDFGTIDPNTKSGTQLATDLNNFRDAQNSQHAGSTAPSYITAGMIWVDSTSADYIARHYDGSQSIPIWQLDAADNVARVLIDADEDSYASADIDDTIRFVLSAAEQFRATPTGVRIGAGNASVGLDMQDKNDGARLPAGTTAQRPTGANGIFRYNTTEDRPEVYQESAWAAINTERSLVLRTESVSWTGTESLDPANGLIQQVTLTGNVTTLTDNLADGELVVLHVDDGTAFSITWPTITWISEGGAEPTLQTTDETVILVWKAGSTLYGCAANGA